jgi:hypothetical protein
LRLYLATDGKGYIDPYFAEALVCTFFMASRKRYKGEPVPYWYHYPKSFVKAPPAAVVNLLSLAIKSEDFRIFVNICNLCPISRLRDCTCAIDNVYGGGTLLHIAAYYPKQHPFLECLLQDDPSILNARTTISGSTALHISCAEQNEHFIMLLIKAGADPMAIDNNGKTAESLIKSKALRRTVQGMCCLLLISDNDNRPCAVSEESCGCTTDYYCANKRT